MLVIDSMITVIFAKILDFVNSQVERYPHLISWFWSFEKSKHFDLDDGSYGYPTIIMQV